MVVMTLMLLVFIIATSFAARWSYEDKLKALRTVKREKKSIQKSDDTIGFRLAITG